MAHQTAITVAVFLLWSVSSTLASEGFAPSDNPNVFNLRDTRTGGTAFLLSLPGDRMVLLTQQHVLAFRPFKLSYGMQYGPVYQPKPLQPNAFELRFAPEVLWVDEEIDVAILRVPDGLIEKCRCQGLDVGSFEPGASIQLIGYPITGRRVYPRVSRWAVAWGELKGRVRQMESQGRAWVQGDEVVSDADALSGNSGGPILNGRGQVVGIIRTMKTWYGAGYKYVKPHMRLTPIETVLERFR